MKHIKLLSLLAVLSFGFISKTNAQCGAAFQYSCAGMFNTIQFYDSSMAFNSGSYTCFWNFGDGTSDTAHNPMHTFNTSGPYHVCLTINNNGCQATYCDTNVHCGGGGAGCQAYFYTQNNGTLQEWFQNASSGTTSTTTYLYTFGDGGNSTQQNPSHTYASAGTYTVCLTINDTANGGCTDSYCMSVTVPLGGNNCQANFNWTSAGNTAAFTNLSSNSGFATYAWTFGDGATSMNVNPAHTYASAGSYAVCLTMTDSSNGILCTSTYCDSVTVGGASGGTCSISGIIGNNGAVQDYATVWLIEHNIANGTLYAVDSLHITPANQGSYVFNNVAAGNYLVKVAADTQSVNYATLVPTYFGNVLFWSSAATVLVCPSQTNVNITLTVGVNPGGPGFVGGLVSQGANRMMNFGDPMQHIEILVLNLNNTPVQYQYSASNGMYGFNNLAYGTYKIYAEVLGKQTFPATVVVDAAHQFINGVNIEINSSYVAVTATNFPNGNLEGVTIFPNPASDVANISYTSNDESDLLITISDITGRVISETPYFVHVGKTTMSLPVKNLEPGMYVINLKANGQSGNYKLSIVK